MRVAVIGCGSMGAMHATLLAAMPGVEELLVVDADADRANQVARRTGARTASAAQAIDEADAIVVATPPHFHADAVMPALAAGRSVLCEKPMTHDLPSSVALARLASAAGPDAHLEIGFQRRHEPAFAAARERLRESRIHLVRLAAFDPLTAAPPPDDWPTGDVAPLFLHSSIHDFDFARWLTGQEVLAVSADGSGRGQAFPDDPRGIETATVTMRLSGGALASLDATWLHPGGYDIRAEVIGESGHLTMGLSARTPAHHLDWVLPEDEARPAAWTGYLERFETAYRNELTAFLAAARGEREPSTTGRDGVEAMRIAVAATRAYVEHRMVALTEIPAFEQVRAASNRGTPFPARGRTPYSPACPWRRRT